MDDEDLGGEELGDEKGKEKKDLTCWGEPTATQREKARRVPSVWRAAEREVGPLSSTVLQAARTDKLIRSGTRQGRTIWRRRVWSGLVLGCPLP